MKSLMKFEPVIKASKVLFSTQFATAFWETWVALGSYLVPGHHGSFGGGTWDSPLPGRGFLFDKAKKQWSLSTFGSNPAWQPSRIICRGNYVHLP